MTNWCEADADKICKGGNRKDADVYLAKWDGKELAVSVGEENVTVIRAFIEAKYVEKKWEGHGGGSRHKSGSKDGSSGGKDHHHHHSSSSSGGHSNNKEAENLANMFTDLGINEARDLISQHGSVDAAAEAHMGKGRSPTSNSSPSNSRRKKGRRKESDPGPDEGMFPSWGGNTSTQFGMPAQGPGPPNMAQTMMPQQTMMPPQPGMPQTMPNLQGPQGMNTMMGMQDPNLGMQQLAMQGQTMMPQTMNTMNPNGMGMQTQNTMMPNGMGMQTQNTMNPNGMGMQNQNTMMGLPDQSMAQKFGMSQGPSGMPGQTMSGMPLQDLSSTNQLGMQGQTMNGMQGFSGMQSQTMNGSPLQDLASTNQIGMQGQTMNGMQGGSGMQGQTMNGMQGQTMQTMQSMQSMPANGMTMNGMNGQNMLMQTQQDLSAMQSNTLAMPQTQQNLNPLNPMTMPQSKQNMMLSAEQYQHFTVQELQALVLKQEQEIAEMQRRLGLPFSSLALSDKSSNPFSPMGMISGTGYGSNGMSGNNPFLL